MNSFNNIFIALALTIATASNSTAREISPREVLIFNPEALANMSLADSGKTIGIPQRCWTLDGGNYCDMWFGVYFIFNKNNQLKSVHYNYEAFSGIRKYGLSELSFNDLESNGKPANKEIIEIWRTLLSAKPDFKSHSMILWKQPSPNIDSVIFTSSTVKKGRELDSSARFEIGSIEVNYK